MRTNPTSSRNHGQITRQNRREKKRKKNAFQHSKDSRGSNTAMMMNDPAAQSACRDFSSARASRGVICARLGLSVGSRRDVCVCGGLRRHNDAERRVLYDLITSRRVDFITRAPRSINCRRDCSSAGCVNMPRICGSTFCLLIDTLSIERRGSLSSRKFITFKGFAAMSGRSGGLMSAALPVSG